MRGRAVPDFDARARDYDTLRPADGAWWARFAALVELGDLRGRRVLDVGCGTGRLAAALAVEARAKVWGIDTSDKMIAVARETVPAGVGIRRGVAESLPFRDGWFDRVTMSLVVHLIDRPRAFAETRRVLSEDGRIAIATFAREHFDTYWLNPWFPSIAEVDRARFPTGDELRDELQAVGLGRVAVVPVSSVEVIDRETALARVRGRHISTFELLPPHEVEEGSARAERELPAQIEIQLQQLIVTASV